MKVNFSKAESSSYDALPKGTYICNVSDAEIRTGKSGNDYINWEFTLDGNPQYDGRKLWSNTTLQEHALFALKGLLEATGKYTEDQLASEDLDFELDDVIGSKIKVVVDQKPKYNGEEGEMDNEVKRYKKVGDNSVEKDTSLLP